MAPLKEYEKKEKGEELKKTSYLVKTRGNNLNKYSSGYRGMKVDSQSKLRLSAPLK